MSKIVFENKKGKITIINKLSYPEAVNERVYNAIASGMFEGFLPVSIRQKRKETRVACVVQGLIPLSQYFDGLVTKKMFLDFVYHVTLLIKSCEKNMMNANNIDLQNDKIFIEPQSKAVKCIFWPVVNNQRANPPHLFLKQLPYELNFNPHEDQEYLESYKGFFGGVNPFSVNSFERFILKLQGKQAEAGCATPSQALSGTLTSEKKVKDKNIAIEYDPFAESDCRSMHRTTTSCNAVCYCGFCGSRNSTQSNFCVHCGKKLDKQSELQVSETEFCDEERGTMVLGDNLGGTTVLGYDAPPEPVFPVLMRRKTEESVEIAQPVYRIGADPRTCDLVLDDNTYISRHHADILTREDRYYIIDHNSTNKTFVDGKLIPAEQEVEIFSGTEIRLANEDFTFSVEL